MATQIRSLVPMAHVRSVADSIGFYRKPGLDGRGQIIGSFLDAGRSTSS